MVEIFPPASGYVLWSFDVWCSAFPCVLSEEAEDVDDFVIVVFKFPSHTVEVDSQLGQPSSELIPLALKCAGFLNVRFLCVPSCSG